MNGLSLSWDSAIGKLGEADTTDFPEPLSRDELLECARHLISSPGMPLFSITTMLDHNETAWAFCHGCVMNLLKWFPVLAVMRNSHIIILNLHEVVLNEHIIDDLIYLNCPPEPVASPATTNVGDTIAVGLTEQSEQPRTGPAKGSSGQMPIHVDVPGIVDALSVFAELQGFSAKSHHTDTGGISFPAADSHSSTCKRDISIFVH